MANFFGVNSSQATTEFEQISKALQQMQGEKVVRDLLDTNTSVRSAQNGLHRFPWIMSTTEWLLGKPPKGLAWEVNPNDIQWTMAQRSMMTKTLIGTVLHVWPNTGRNTFFDEFRITLNLQTGNIMPVILKSGDFQPSGGLANFYDFMQLVDAPKLTIGDSKQPPRANLVTIQYRSNVFPALTLMGMFDPAGIKFTDTSQDNQVTSWSVDFVVYETIPKLATFSGQSQNPLLQAMFGVQKGLSGGTPQGGGATPSGSTPSARQQGGNRG